MNSIFWWEVRHELLGIGRIFGGHVWRWSVMIIILVIIIVLSLLELLFSQSKKALSCLDFWNSLLTGIFASSLTPFLKKKIIYFLLKDNCFTEFCCFLSNLNMNPTIGTYIPFLLKLPPVSLPIPPLPTPSEGWYRASEFPEPYSKFTPFFYLHRQANVSS